MMLLKNSVSPIIPDRELIVWYSSDEKVKIHNEMANKELIKFGYLKPPNGEPIKMVKKYENLK